MVLPSSPPLLPLTHDLRDPSSSPPPLPTRHSPHGRKRQACDYSNLSSDPVFSEDASEADACDYDVPRKRKRHVRGPWWLHAGINLRRGQRKKGNRRNIDSGVWMGSDSSDAATAVASSRSGSVSGESRSLSDQDVQGRNPHLPSMKADANTIDPVSLATRIVTQCLDNGMETVDLSNIGLRDLPGSVLRPLHQLVRQVHVESSHPPSEEEFAPLTPYIKLFLSGNGLEAVPSELYRLAHISVLSLRNNELRELPSAVARFPDLQELNVAGNGLGWLPWELLDPISCCGGHKQITVRPNPLHEPNASVDALCELGEGIITGDGQGDTQANASGSHASGCETCSGRSICLSSSTITYFDIDGSRRSGRPAMTLRSGTSHFDKSLAIQPDPALVSNTGHGAAPSLFELALRSVQSNCNITDHSSFENEDISPTVLSALRQASRGQHLGNDVCSTCGKPFVIARAEWMEFWHCGPSSGRVDRDMVLPFLRKTCSWACAKPTRPGMQRNAGKHV